MAPGDLALSPVIARRTEEHSLIPSLPRACQWLYGVLFLTE